MEPVRQKYVPIPRTGKCNVNALAAAMYYLLVDGSGVPEWMRGAAKELCRDFHVTMMPDPRVL